VCPEKGVLEILEFLRNSPVYFFFLRVKLLRAAIPSAKKCALI
jgi:hypothetical protein